MEKKKSVKEIRNKYSLIAPYLESGEEQHIDLKEKLRLAIEIDSKNIQET